MSTKIRKLKEKFEVVCDDGVLLYDSLDKAEKKVRSLHSLDMFGFVKKTILDEKNNVVDEIYCG